MLSHLISVNPKNQKKHEKHETNLRKCPGTDCAFTCDCNVICPWLRGRMHTSWQRHASGVKPAFTDTGGLLLSGVPVTSQFNRHLRRNDERSTDECRAIGLPQTHERG